MTRLTSGHRCWRRTAPLQHGVPTGAQIPQHAALAGVRRTPVCPDRRGGSWTRERPETDGGRPAQGRPRRVTVRGGGHHTMTRPRRAMWLCTACRRCRRHTTLRAREGHLWCARCQAMQLFRPVKAMPQMRRRQAPVGAAPGGGVRPDQPSCRQAHPLGRAHSATPARHGTVIYVVCGWQGCARRLALPVAAWEAEVARRQGLSSEGTAWERTRETQQGRTLAGDATPPDGRMP